MNGAIGSEGSISRQPAPSLMLLESRSCTEEVISGLDKVVSTMKKGEVALVTISPEHGFGDVETKGDLAVVPPNSTLVYELELVDFVKVNTWPTSCSPPPLRWNSRASS